MQDTEIIEQIPMGRKSAYLLRGDAPLQELRARFELPRLDPPGPALLQALRSRPHAFTLQLTDAHWVLYMTRCGDKPLNVLTNLSDGRSHLVELNFEAAVYDGTVVYGEVVRHAFLISDLFVYKGDARFAARTPLDQRRLIAQHLFGAELRGDPQLDCFEFHQKPLFPMSALGCLQHINDSLRCFRVAKARALLVLPLAYEAPWMRNFQYRLQHHELRPNSHKDTLDTSAHHELLLRKHAELPDVYKATGPESRDMGHAHVASQMHSLQLRAAFDGVQERRLLCSFNRAFKKWQPCLPSTPSQSLTPG